MSGARRGIHSGIVPPDQMRKRALEAVEARQKTAKIVSSRPQRLGSATDGTSLSCNFDWHLLSPMQAAAMAA